MIAPPSYVPLGGAPLIWGENSHTETLVLSRANSFSLCLSFPLKEGWFLHCTLLRTRILLYVPPSDPCKPLREREGLGASTLDSGFLSPEKTAMHLTTPPSPFPWGEGSGLGSLGQASWPQGSSPPPLEPRLEPEIFHTESLAADTGTFAIS